MKTRAYSCSGSPSLMIMIMITLLVAGGTLVSIAFNPFASRKRAFLARDLNHGRQVKFAHDSFAIDFNGQYPNADTGEKLVKGGTGTKFSNDFFRQLFLSGEIDSELIFWVQGASVCNAEKPDDHIADGGKPVAKEIRWPLLPREAAPPSVDRHCEPPRGVEDRSKKSRSDRRRSS